MVGTGNAIFFQIVSPETAKAAVFAQLKHHLPHVVFRERDDLLIKHLRPDRAGATVLVDFGLAREWFLPLPLGRGFATDTLLPLIAGFEELTSDEMACLQVLSSRTRLDWARAAKTVIIDGNGQQALDDIRDGSSGIKDKLSRNLLAVQIRLIVQADSRERALYLARQTGPFFKQFSLPAGNELFPLQNADGLEPKKQLELVTTRTTHRSGLIISAQELGGIFHLPSDAVRSQKLKRDGGRTKPAPAFASIGTCTLGESTHEGETRIIKLTNEQRLKHVWVTGASGSGKSTLITHLAVSDALAGNGFCVIEPHSDLIDGIVTRIPQDRLRDVVLFDPADERYPVAFNPLHANSELEKSLLTSDLTAIFQRFWTSQGDVMTNVFHNAVLAFLSSTAGGNLIDLRNFLVDKDFRNRFLETIDDEEIKFYWTNEFPSLARRITPLMTRLNLFLRSRIIRNILAPKDNRLDFRRIMDERKILLVKLTHGAIGGEQAQLLGSLVIAKLYQTALSRQNIAIDDRSPFFISIDEAHHHLVPSISLLIAEGRKYGVGVLISTQDTQQIASRDADVLASLTTNSYTRICFRGDTDNEKIAKAFSFFTADHLRDLGVGEAICRLERSTYDFNLKTFQPKPVEPELARRNLAAIIDHSRKAYATPIKDIEEEQISERQAARTSAAGWNPGTGTDHAGRADEMPPVGAPTSGRGGPHHQQLQMVVKRIAETYGFKADIERSVLDGGGRVDVSLEKANMNIAVEVSVSTVGYEVTNVAKCFSAGYDRVFVVASNLKKLALLSSKIFASIPIGLHDRVRVLGIGDLLAYLREVSECEGDTTASKTKKSTGQRLDFAGACELLGKSRSTLYRWVREGRIPFFRVGREYEFDRDELLLIGKHDLSGKLKAKATLSPLTIEKRPPKTKKQQDERYRKLLGLDKMDVPLRTRREKEANDD
jgi:excisionase family DNA binding protein